MNAHSCGQITPLISRREILSKLACGFGWLAFSGLSAGAKAAGGGPLAPRAPQFAPKAKRVIFLCMRGGPSHVDTFDYKPQLAADADKPGRRPGTRLMAPKWKFQQRGKS